MIRLMNYCVVTLEAAGMEKMFLDGVRGGAEGFQAIGKLQTHTVEISIVPVLHGQNC